MMMGMMKRFLRNGVKAKKNFCDFDWGQFGG